jgi:hypothetical protein
MSRAGYKGKHGQFEVADDDKVDMFGMYMQATLGDVISSENDEYCGAVTLPDVFSKA